MKEGEIMTGEEAKKRLKKQYKRQNDFIKEKYDRLSIALPPGTKERIKAAGEKPNSLIKRLLLSWLENNE